MFIEKIIELELRGPGPPGRTCNPKTGYFHDKTKISKESLRVHYYVLLKILYVKSNVTCFPLSGPSHFKIYPKNARF